MAEVAIYGAGQLGHGVAGILRSRGRHLVSGPFGRSDRSKALSSGADLVVIATTTRMRDVIEDIGTAVAAGSNVLVSAEECANPWLVDSVAAERLHQQALHAGVTILGAGLNPGLIFDALVLTLLGAVADGTEVSVTRTVDISRFGPAVLARLGVGFTPEEFTRGLAAGEILGHAGFPQSISIVGRALGRPLDLAHPVIEPFIADEDITLADGRTIATGLTAGVNQKYQALEDGRAWFVAHFIGHVKPAMADLVLSDVIVLRKGDTVIQEFRATPCFPSQAGSQHVLANSVERVIQGPPGWISVADLPPAMPMVPREGA